MTGGEREKIEALLVEQVCRDTARMAIAVDRLSALASTK